MLKLRPYQSEAELFLKTKIIKENRKKLGLIMPTGAGKSVTVTYLLKRLKDAKLIKTAVIAVPQNQIKDSFKSEKDLIINASYSKNLDSKYVSSGMATFSGDEFIDINTKVDKLKTFTNHLTSENLSFKDGYILKISHSLISTYKDLLPENLNERILIIDEAHHCGEKSTKQSTKLYAVADEWNKRGGIVLLVTATPFRTDGAKVLTDDMDGAVYNHSIIAHAQSGYAPSNYNIGVVTLDCTAENWKEFSGQDFTSDDFNSFDIIVEQWKKDNEPKTVVIIPSGGDGDLSSSKYAQKLADTFRQHKSSVRILDAVGVGKDKQEALKEALAKESEAKSYEDSQVDVVIACKRFDEGTDWKFCSHVYNIGVPHSESLVLQRFGRSQRDKSGIENYPEQYKDSANMKFFVPKLKNPDELFDQHHSTAFYIAALMADYELASNLKGFDFYKVELTGNEDVDIREVEKAQILSSPLSVELDAFKNISNFHQALVESNEKEGISIGEIYEFAIERQKNGDITEQELIEIEKLLIKEIAQNNAPAVEKISKGFSGINYDMTKSFDKKARKIFKEIIEEYSHQTSLIAENVKKAYSSFSGEDAKNIAERFSEKYLLTEEMIVEAAKKHYEKHGEYPSCSSKEYPEILGIKTWGGVHTALRDGTRGLPGGISLLGLLIKHGLKEEINDLNEEIIIEAAKKYYKENGIYPTNKSKGNLNISGLNTWAGIDMALKHGHRGLLGGSSLHKLLLKYGLKEEKNKLTEEIVIKAIKKYYEKHGEYPTQYSKEDTKIPGARKWKNIDICLRDGYRGLSGGSSLTKILFKYNLKEEKIELSEEVIIEALKRYYKEYGIYPRKDYKGDPGIPGLKTWGGVNAVLREGYRGLQGGSSIAELRKKYKLIDDPNSKSRHKSKPKIKGIALGPLLNKKEK